MDELVYLRDKLVPKKLTIKKKILQLNINWIKMLISLRFHVRYGPMPPPPPPMRNGGGYYDEYDRAPPMERRAPLPPPPYG